MTILQLDDIAQGDEVYLFWKQCVEDLDAPFREYLKNLPRTDYQLVSGYVGACCMMLQRKALLACENTPGKKKNP